MGTAGVRRRRHDGTLNTVHRWLGYDKRLVYSLFELMNEEEERTVKVPEGSKSPLPEDLWPIVFPFFFTFCQPSIEGNSRPEDSSFHPIYCETGTVGTTGSNQHLERVSLSDNYVSPSLCCFRCELTLGREAGRNDYALIRFLLSGFSRRRGRCEVTRCT